MPIGTSDGQVYKDDLDEARNLFLSSQQQAPGEPSAKITVTKLTPSEEAPVDTRSQELGIPPSIPIEADEEQPAPEPPVPEDFDSPENIAAQRVRRSVMNRSEGKLTAIHEAVGRIPIETIKRMKYLTEGAMRLQPGESLIDHPELVNAGASVAFDLLGIGLATMPFKTGLGLFGGRMSKRAVNFATDLESKGASTHTIKEMSGLERGADSMWRREFSDASAKLDVSKFKTSSDAEGTFKVNRLGEVLKHDELFKIYPEASNITTVIVPTIKYNPKALGLIDSSTNTIYLKGGLSKSQTTETLLHEIQHWIQNKEGFSFLSKEMLSKEFIHKFEGELVVSEIGIKTSEDLLKAIKENFKGYPDGTKEKVIAWANKKLTETGYETYRRLASEVEARNVETRMSLTPKSIKQVTGESTEDVPRSNQIR